MTDCQALSSHTQNTVLITKDNLYELIPDTFSLSPGTQVTVSCVTGLNLVGTSSFVCQNNGQWSYTTKPYCTDEPEKTATDETLDETSKIIIGVVCGIAALIVIALIVMIIIIVHKDRRRRRERREFWESIRNERQSPEYRGVDGPSTIDMEMYTRYPPALPPPPYEYGRSSRDRDVERGSRLSNPVYLPGYGRPEHKERHGYEKKARRSKSYDDLSETGKEPYVRDWVTRSSMIGSDEYRDTRPGVHGSRHGRDPFLWRQTNY